MKITVERRDLTDALNWALLGLPAHPLCAALAAMRVMAADGQLAMAAFDYDRATRATVPASVAEPGSLLLKGKSLRDAVRALPKGKRTDPVVLHADGGALTLECQSAICAVPELPAGDQAVYPDHPQMPPEAGTVDGAAFVRSLARVLPAASRDETLPVIATVYLNPVRDHLVLAATDRYRLAVDKVPWTPHASAVSAPPALLRWQDAAVFLRKAAKADRVTLHLPPEGDAHTHQASLIGLSDGRHELIAHGITHGEYVRYARLIPEQAAASVLVDAAQLAEAVRLAGIASAHDAGRGWAPGDSPVRLNAARESVTVTGGRDGAATFRRDVAAESDADLGALFDPRYLASMLEGFCGEVCVSFREIGTGPVRIAARGGGDPFLAVLMPISER